MNKLEFVNEIGALADKFAYLLQDYTASHDDGYAGKTESGEPIIIAGITVSIQNGELATVGANIGGGGSDHKITINRYPNCGDEWRIEDK
jgi:hypothetical protein